MYAIIESCGKHLKVSEGDTVVIDKQKAEAREELLFDKVLMIAGDKGVVVGRPYVKGASVKAEIISAMKAPKILVWKHQPKKAHEKVTGHRQQYSVIKIKEIVGG